MVTAAKIYIEKQAMAAQNKADKAVGPYCYVEGPLVLFCAPC
jgi:hypothetical protein